MFVDLDSAALASCGEPPTKLKFKLKLQAGEGAAKPGRRRPCNDDAAL